MNHLLGNLVPREVVPNGLHSHPEAVAQSCQHSQHEQCPLQQDPGPGQRMPLPCLGNLGKRCLVAELLNLERGNKLWWEESGLTRTVCVVVMATGYLLLQLVQLSQDISASSFRHLLAISVALGWTHVLVSASLSWLSHSFLKAVRLHLMS